MSTVSKPIVLDETARNINATLQQIKTAIENGGGGGDVSNKADKVTNATTGNLASLTADGNLADSEVSATEITELKENLTELEQKAITSTEEESYEPTVPRDADTLGGRITAEDVDGLKLKFSLVKFQATTNGGSDFGAYKYVGEELLAAINAQEITNIMAIIPLGVTKTSDNGNGGFIVPYYADGIISLNGVEYGINVKNQGTYTCNFLIIHK